MLSDRIQLRWPGYRNSTDKGLQFARPTLCFVEPRMAAYQGNYRLKSLQHTNAKANGQFFESSQTI
ncbi:MAG: hypothetical protein CMJ77_22065 [Planctomycetaceae bacterium]|nr:hypothetical protein [Planctomycetaceae bacterium]